MERTCKTSPQICRNGYLAQNIAGNLLVKFMECQILIQSNVDRT